MPANRHRYAQAFPLAATLIGAVIAVCFVGFLIKALMVKHEVMQDGDRIKRLEKELIDLNIKNEAFQTKKDQLTSVPALRKALEKKVIHLMPIEDRFVVNVGQSRPAVATVVGTQSVEAR
jgi:hypothetical protein